MRFSGFEWDAGNKAKCQKHGVSISEIEALFSGVVGIVPDLRHSLTEERLKAFGKTAAGRGVLIVFTLRRKDKGLLIRPISARYMHRKETALYEEKISDFQNR